MESMRLGKYVLGSRLGQGGMAEVYRAKVRGAAGFEKEVALKMILPASAEDPAFVTRFVEEAGVSALLNHPNLVQTYDFGCIGGRYFLAMELVDGVAVTALLRGGRLGEALALHIAANVAAALDYAFFARGKDGAALELVHRDVTPSNVLVSRHGAVKLSDFGIAHFAGRSTATAAGSLTGKFAYMSPEQAWARPLDARSDVFALGLLVMELATGERALHGDNDIELLESARTAKLRAAPQLSPAFAALVADATRVVREERIPSAAVFRSRCAALLAAQPHGDLSFELSASVIRAMPTHDAGSRDADKPIAPHGTEVGTPIAAPTRQRPRWPVVAASAALVACVAGTTMWVRPNVARKALAAQQSPLPTVPRSPPSPATAAPGLPPSTTATVARVASPAPVPASASQAASHKRARVRNEPGILRLAISPWGEAFIDGKSYGEPPFTALELPAGAHTIEVRHPQLGAQHRRVTLSPGEPKLVQFDLTKAQP